MWSSIRSRQVKWWNAPLLRLKHWSKTPLMPAPSGLTSGSLTVGWMGWRLAGTWVPILLWTRWESRAHSKGRCGRAPDWNEGQILVSPQPLLSSFNHQGVKHLSLNNNVVSFLFKIEVKKKRSEFHKMLNGNLRNQHCPLEVLRGDIFKKNTFRIFNANSEKKRICFGNCPISALLKGTVDVEDSHLIIIAYRL